LKSPPDGAAEAPGVGVVLEALEVAPPNRFDGAGVVEDELGFRPPNREGVPVGPEVLGALKRVDVVVVGAVVDEAA
jgi:hypothetical protein